MKDEDKAKAMKIEKLRKQAEDKTIPMEARNQLKDRANMLEQEMGEGKKARPKYTGVDERGRRTTQSDSRVSEKAKADLPSYGFQNMTIGEIMSERKRVDKERKGRKEAVGYAKGGVVANKGIGASMAPHNMFGKKK